MKLEDLTELQISYEVAKLRGYEPYLENGLCKINMYNSRRVAFPQTFSACDNTDMIIKIMKEKDISSVPIRSQGDWYSAYKDQESGFITEEPEKGILLAYLHMHHGDEINDSQDQTEKQDG